jgi:hypothetical protein
MDHRRNEFVLGSPPKEANHFPDSLVDLVATKSRFDHRVSQGLERKRTELLGQCMAVKLPKWSHLELDIFDFPRPTTVLAILTLGVFEIRQQQFVDERSIGRIIGEPTTVGEPFGNETVILRPTLRRVVEAEIKSRPSSVSTA